MEVHSTATNGARCAHESHRFRLGVDVRTATVFSADAGGFHGALLGAFLEQRRPACYLQVECGAAAGWRNVQNRTTGGVVAVTNETTDRPETSATVFGWACNSVQMARDLDVIAHGEAGETG